MSEFVECQSCGRRFFAENLVCPYCGGGGGDDADDEAVTELMRLVAPSTRGAPPRRSAAWVFDLLFHAFAVLAAGGAILALAGLARTESGLTRARLGFEAAFALTTFTGVIGRRRWGRWAAIAFIYWTVARGMWSLSNADLHHVPWSAGLVALLLFLYPFLSARARERFTR